VEEYPLDEVEEYPLDEVEVASSLSSAELELVAKVLGGQFAEVEVG
jgi:hypothetical protein